jgi:hypothetical protein
LASRPARLLVVALALVVAGGVALVIAASDRLVRAPTAESDRHGEDRVDEEPVNPRAEQLAAHQASPTTAPLNSGR